MRFEVFVLLYYIKN